MQYRMLGRSGVQVSAVGLGGNTFGRTCDQQQTTAIVRRALDLGVNHFDCADTYGGGGVSEEYLGKALAGRRDEAVIATKTGFPLGSGPNSEGLSRRRIINNCEASLKRLGTDYVDIYYLHRPDPHTDVSETLAALDDLVRQGKVRYAACSNYSGWEIARLCERALAHDWAVPVVTQSPYNMLARDIEREIIPAARAYGLSVVPYSPLAGGVLTGKYARGEAPPPGTRAHNNPRLERLLGDDVLGVVAELDAFASQRGHTAGQLAIAWLLAQPAVCSVIAGVTQPEQVETNAAAANWTLSESEVDDLEAILAKAPKDVNR